MLQELTERIVQIVDGRDKLGFDVKFDLGDDGIIFVHGNSEPIAVGNDGGDAETVFVVSAGNLHSMLAGDLSPMMAYMQGKLKIHGDLGRAMQINSLFS